MKIVGIHDGHNASACLLEDGHIVAAIQEERLCREKNWAGFPSCAVEFVLRKAGRNIADIDVFAFSGIDMPDQMTREQRLSFYQRDCFPLVLQGGIVRQMARSTGLAVVRRKFQKPGPSAREVRLQSTRSIGIPDDRVRFLEHHRCHAAAAYYGWSRYGEDVLVLTNDGEGDRVCATVNIGRKGRIERVASVPHTESIANLYAVTTFLLGMTPLEHEYKLMGMAPYASPQAAERVAEKYLQLIDLDADVGWKRANGCPPTLHTYS